MDIIDKVFAKLNKEETPGDLRAKIMDIPFAGHGKVPQTGRFKFLTRILTPAVALLLIIVGFYYFRPVPNYAAAFELTPDQYDVAGVTPGSSFILKSAVDIPTRYIKQIVHFVPDVDFDVQNLGDKQYKITPKGDLSVNTIYKIAIPKGPADHEYSWAYQIKAPFQVIGTTPADKASSAPINAGIEIQFNREKFVNPEKYFSIEPNVAGKFDQHGPLLVFMPSKNLDENTIYRVTIKKGLGIEGSSDILTSDYSFKFQTSDSAMNYYYSLAFTYDFQQFLAGKEPVLPASAYNVDTNNIKIQVYSFNSPDDFLNTYTTSRDWDFPWNRTSQDKYMQNITGRLNKVTEFTTALNNNQIVFPSALNSGDYLVVMNDSANKVHWGTWLQVTPLAHYAAFSYDKSALWLYDLVKQSPVQNASVSFAGSNLVRTNDKGYAEFSTPSAMQDNSDNYSSYSAPKFLAVDAQGYGRYFVTDQDSTYNWSTALKWPQKYWTAFSTDRPIYQLTDKISFWGVARPRNGASSLQKVTVGLDKGGYYYPLTTLINPDNGIASTDVAVSANGTFQGELPFSGLDPGYYTLTVKDGEKTLESLGINVYAYQKPSYVLDVQPEQQNYFAGDQMKFKVTAKFYNGAPVSNLQVKYQANWDGDWAPLTLDKNGEGTIVAVKEYDKSDKYGPYSYWPTTYYMSVKPALAEEALITGGSTAQVYGSNVQLALSNQKYNNDKSTTFTYKLNQVDLNKLNDPSLTYEQRQGDPVPNYPLHVKVTRVTYEQHETGEYYDYIYKTTYKTYDYTRKEEPVEEFDAKTDSSGQYVLQKKYDDSALYQVDVTATDNRGRVSWQRSYVYSHFVDLSNFYGLYNDDAFALQPEGKDRSDIAAHVGEQFKLSMSSDKYDLNQRDVLVLKYQQSVMGGTFVRGTQFSDTFKDTDRPGVGYMAVIATDHGFIQSNSVGVNQDLDESNLNIQIMPDQKEYKPGAQAKIGVKVTDNKGNPEQAEVNVSVVDKSVIDLEPYNIADVFAQINSSIVRLPIVNATYYNNMQGPGGKGGGGGDNGYARQNFKDTALFQTITTDGSGQGSVTFTLPDNLTEWKIYARAFDSDKIRAGQEESSVTTALPLFVDATAAPNYLAGDQPIVRLRVYGKQYDQNQPVHITAKNNQLGINYSADISNGNAAQINLPALKAGNYTLDIAASQGNNSDRLEKQISVINTYFEKPVSKQYDLSNGLTGISGASDSMTTLIFADRGRGQFVSDLQGMEYTRELRSDEKVAEYFAQKTLHDTYGLGDAPEPLNVDQFQQNDWGYSAVTWGSSDLTLTAKIAALAHGSIPGGQTSTYLYRALYDQKADVHRISQALFGLAYLDQPVLTQLQQIKDDPNLSVDDKMYVAAGLAQMGDKESARKIYYQDIKNNLKNEAGQTWVAVSSEDKDATIQTTSLAAVVAAQLDESGDLQGMWKYIQNNYMRTNLNLLEKGLVIESALENLDTEPASFTYQIGSAKTDVSLDNGIGKSIQIMPQDLDKISFSNVRGSIQVVATYETPSDYGGLHTPNMSITRSYTVNGKATTNINDGDLVKVVLTINAHSDLANTHYQIQDYLPSGLMPVTQMWGSDIIQYGDPNSVCINYPTSVVNNKLSFDYYPVSSPSCPANQIWYYARVVNAGTFKADPARINEYGDEKNISVSAPQTIQIQY